MRMHVRMNSRFARRNNTSPKYRANRFSLDVCSISHINYPSIPLRHIYSALRTFLAVAAVIGPSRETTTSSKEISVPPCIPNVLRLLYYHYCLHSRNGHVHHLQSGI